MKLPILAIIVLLFSAVPAFSQVEVVSSIRPIHSLVANVLLGSPSKHTLIVNNYGSAHHYSLKPSDLQNIQDADLIFWVGKDLESFLAKPIAVTAKKADKVSLIDEQSIIKLKPRERLAANIENDHDEDAHGHDDHDEDEHGHDEHGHDAHKEDAHGHDDHDEDEHGHDEHKEDAHGHDDHGHAHDYEFDPHIWLDPENAKIIVKIVSDKMVKLDPQNSALYESNRKTTIQKLDELHIQIEEILKSENNADFLTVHDAYRYFENRYGLNSTGYIIETPEDLVSAAKLDWVIDTINSKEKVCIFTEPGFNEDLLLDASSIAQIEFIDPTGATMTPSENLYFELMTGTAQSIKNCLNN